MNEMRIYRKDIEYCNECPACVYEHFDGEGESAPFAYYNAFCDRSKCRKLSYDDILKEKTSRSNCAMKYVEGTKVPIRKIPDWCPLEKREK